ncbi:Voltage-dependent N-type calcium channel subunit alpha-1B, partial [Geodia barretti]
MAQRLRDDQILTLSSSDESKLETASPFRHGRSKSIDDVHRQMVKSYITHVGAPKTDFPDPKVSLVVVWLRACLQRLGRGSLDYSLLIFHKNNCFRKNVKKAVKSKFFNMFFAVVVLVNALILLFVHEPTEWGDYKDQNLVTAYVSILFLLAYVVESGMRIVAYGLIFHPKAYLRSSINILDLFPILFGFLYLILTLARVYEWADVFGALMAIKLIRVLSVFKTVRFILKALAKSMIPLVFVSVIQLCVMVFFTFLGMELFQGCGLHNGCFANYTDPTGELQSVVVSEFPCSMRGDGGLGVHRCPGNSQCQEWGEGPKLWLRLLRGLPEGTADRVSAHHSGGLECCFLPGELVGALYNWVQYTVCMFGIMV